MTAPRLIHGVIFSDLGRASAFMSLDWVQKVLADCLGFAPFPATLNLRPASREDAAAWESIQRDPDLFFNMPSHEGACSARIFRVEVRDRLRETGRKTAAAVLLPQIMDYPKDKIEIVAPMRVKDAFGVQDGDPLTLEFIH